MILGCELMALNVINSSMLWMARRTLGHELRALDVMNSSGMWLT